VSDDDTQSWSVPVVGASAAGSAVSPESVPCASACIEVIGVRILIKKVNATNMRKIDVDRFMA
jgi:hypothetical protein